ncbi:MAG: hypothetical protein ABSC06_07220 [Rhodopila sp.]
MAHTETGGSRIGWRDTYKPAVQGDSIAVAVDASIRSIVSFCIYGQSMYQGVTQAPCLTPHRPAPFFGASAPDLSFIEMQGFRRSPLKGQPPSQKVIFGRLIDDRCRLFRLHHITAHKDESCPRQIRAAQELRRRLAWHIGRRIGDDAFYDLITVGLHVSRQGEERGALLIQQPGPGCDMRRIFAFKIVVINRL